MNNRHSKGRAGGRGSEQAGLNSRAQAARQVHQVLNGHSLSEQKLGDSNAHDPLRQALIYTTLRHLSVLQAILSGYLDKPLRTRDADLRCLLLVGLAEITWFATPDHAVLDETVKASRQLDKSWARGLVNAVLRNHLRSGPPAPEQLLATIDDPSVRYSHPQWLVEKLVTAWPDHWQGILDANNQQAPMSLRVNLARITRDEYLHLLAKADINAIALPLADSAIVLSKALAVADLPGFDDGLVSIQDEAAQLAASLLNARDNMSVLDACAAPGGKTAHLLERSPQLSLIAMDADPQRCPMIQQNLDRLGLTATVVNADAGALEEGQFDRILLDAPCSATGVIRRHPDIKWLRRSTDMVTFEVQQRRLLDQLWQRLKSGGRLLYATCSLLPTENHSTIEAFSAATPDARVLPLTLAGGLDTGWGHQLLPGQDDTDGFFYALLEKA